MTDQLPALPSSSRLLTAVEYQRLVDTSVDATYAKKA